ncbi:unnamed protein product [Auanema sp. JU1783]|nr:unnamed protein product [Auanema sp. JU1783]
MALKANVSRPLCSDIYQDSSELGANVILHVLLNVAGIVCNICLLLSFSGRSKLCTASFTYIRILGIAQFLFFILPFPLKLLTEHYQRGQTWFATNFLPLVLGLFHFMITCNAFCLSVRLQLLINYVRRCRRWSAQGWVAWRKTCWVVPFGIITNVSLCFEYSLDYQICLTAYGQAAIGQLRLSDAVKGDNMKLEFIRATPTMIFWLTMLFTLTFLSSERCILPKLGSPYAAKHIPLLSNLRTILFSIILAHSIVHLSYTITLLKGERLDDSTKLTLFAISYSLPFPLIFLISKTFRSHVFHILTNICHTSNFRRNRTRKDSTIRRVTNHIARSVAYSKLEMENSELDDRFLEHSFRSVLKEDAIYRIRFALPQTVEVIEEEDESFERRLDLHHHSDENLDIESAEYLQRIQITQTEADNSIEYK